MWNFHGSLSYEEFLTEWFGLHGGRELGTPDQYYTDNPLDIIKFVEDCRELGKPAFMSVTPRRRHDKIFGIDRLFFDFDAHKKSLRTQVERDTMKFARKLIKRKIKPLIVKTAHGYHVYVFFKEGCLSVDGLHAKFFYMACQNQLLNGENYKTICARTLYNVKTLSRIPLSWHESGAWVTIVDEDLNPVKIRGLDRFRLYGVDNEFVERAVKTMKMMIIDEEIRRKEFNEKPLISGLTNLRPCYEFALEQSEMDHLHRLALVAEAYWVGKTEEQIVDLFRHRRDYLEGKTNYQVRWQLEKLSKDPIKPYRCETMIGLGWCLKSRCPIWVRKFKK